MINSILDFLRSDAFRGDVIFMLTMLPFLLIGFVSGMLYMRSCYLRELDKVRLEARRIQREAERTAHNSYYQGYARRQMEEMIRRNI